MLENAGVISNTNYYGGYCYAVELEDVVYRYLQNRDVQMETDIQHPGDDSYKDQYICEVGCEFHENLIKSITYALARRFLMKKTECAYFAGVVDGEGCIRINKVLTSSRGKKYLAYRPFLSITNTNQALVDKLCYLSKPSSKILEHREKKNPNNRPQLRATWTDSRCLELLKLIRPYVTRVKKQLDLVLNFYTHLKKAKHRNNRFGVPQEELAWREEQISKLALLKRGSIGEPIDDNSVNSVNTLQGQRRAKPDASQEGVETIDGTPNLGDDIVRAV